MGYITGMLKYIAKGPFTNPIAFFIYGSFFLALFNGVTAVQTGGSILEAAIAYYSTKYLPPTTILDIVAPILIGSVIAGIKWFMNTPQQ
jgi:hypothetical protein